MICSVVVPAYNEPDIVIAATIATARQAIVADGRNHEIIVVDDGSARPVGSIACPWTRLVRIPHGGIAAALNAGVAAATGAYVCWLSVGDGMDRDKLSVQIQVMAETGALASFHDYRNAEGVFRSRPEWRKQLETDNQFCGSTTMVARTVAVACPFDEQLTYAIDWDWANRVEYEGPGWHYIPQVLGEAYELPGGHTDTALRDPAKADIKRLDKLLVHRRWRHSYANKERARGHRL